MYEYNSKILRVVDGDTIDVDIDLGFGITMVNQRIRLQGVDTPESRTRDLEEKKFGLLAKKIVQGYCPEESKIVLVTTKDDRGKFGRILGDFKVYDAKVDAWLMLSDVLINGGFAVRYHGQSKEEIKEAHFFNREKVRGLLAE